MSAVTRWGFALAALFLVALFASLGAWQLGRGRDKAATLADSADVLAARRAQPLAAAAQEPGRKLAWVEGAGRFDARGALLLDNQQRGGRAGVRVYRIFVPEDAAPPLLVDLGWLPLPPDRRLPTIPLPEGRRVLRGLMAPPPSVGIEMGAGIVRAGPDWLMTRVDRDAIAAATGLDAALASRVLRLDPALDLGFERDLELLPNTLPPERHYGYAVQWFALAVTVAVIYFLLSWRARRRKSE